MESYELYCLADRRFYDSPTNRGAEASGLRALSRGRCPDGWEHVARRDLDALRAGGSASCRPRAGRSTSRPGSTTPSGRSRPSGTYCVPRGIAFKFLRNEPVLVMVELEVRPARFERQAGHHLPGRRGPAGAGAQGARRPARRCPGPYILSDLRYGDRPALRPVRRLRQPLLPVDERRAGARPRERARPAGPGPSRPDLLDPAVGHAAALPAAASGRPQRGHHQRAGVHDRERHPVLQRRRRLPRPPQRDRRRRSCSRRAGRCAGLDMRRPRRGRPDRLTSATSCSASKDSTSSRRCTTTSSSASTTSWSRSSSTRTRCSASWSAATR